MTHHTNSHDASDEVTVERRMERFLETVEAIGGKDEHRRELLVEQAEDRGLDRTTAEQAYDIALEERLNPASGLGLVIEGVSVQPLESPRPDVDTSEPNEPEWVDAPPEPALAERERRLRQTFRRFRSHMDAEASVTAAAHAFFQEPDLEPYRY